MVIDAPFPRTIIADGWLHGGLGDAVLSSDLRKVTQVVRDYSLPVLAGPGQNDYARYMRTDELLCLQRGPSETIHRDELLFQTVHQSTELWLKLACAEIREADRLIAGHSVDASILLIDRASLSVRLITDQLDMLRTLAPHDFQAIRTILGNGSGFESPGWRGLRDVGEHMARTFADLIEDYGTDLVEIYTGPAHRPLYRLAEALLTLDERVSLWRVNHYKLAVRIVGNGTTGTKGTPVDALAKLINYKFFPLLWAVRTKLVRIGPMHDGDEAGDQ